MSQVQTTTTEPRNISESVIEAVAEAKGVDPLELTPPLYEVIEPDALDQIFATTPTGRRVNGQVVFSYDGYVVTACGDGYVSVEEQEE